MKIGKVKTKTFLGTVFSPNKILLSQKKIKVKQGAFELAKVRPLKYKYPVSGYVLMIDKKTYLP